MKITTMQEKILNAAENLIQTMGYNAFSYKDIAHAVGIKTSSIHYYYPAKEDLATAVIEWHLERVSVLLDELNANNNLSLQAKLLSLVDIVISLTISNDLKMCLGGMLASDVISLPEKVKKKVCIFFDTLERWIRETLSKEKKANSSWRNLYTVNDLAKYLIVQLEGGLLMTRLYKDFSYIETVKNFIKITL
ncbi:TetR family transcriptional regulator [Legionella beliardensis]|uniref:TetR family transcriptional regulator n=1 Tax=Legionella beliardensis TaxID=91822 RepID=A0A378JRK9_9GAMM|nr:TetR/AcrR family transcriptional regulator [Legionella beliardensis]STX55798.1 TetR family transcriptional regulator [Legionella beliardensis]